jgi:carbamoyl-phosphate synthase large subunit
MVCQIRNTLPLVPELSGGRVYIADSDLVTPAGHYADGAFRVPRIHDPNYISRLLELCRAENIRVILPLIDIDMLRLAPHLDAFREIGTTLVCPPEEIVELCFDKNRFDAFAASKGIRVPRTFFEADLQSAPYPLFFKPRAGFGSRDTGVAKRVAEALQALERNPDLLFQECLTGTEISVDGFVSTSGGILHAVQRVRDKIIGGEAVRTHTIKLESIRQASVRVFAALAELGFHGPANIQFFESSDPVLFDVNPRLGLGGSTLSNVATKGRYFESILREACDGVASASPDDYEEGLGLYKFLGELFHETKGEVRAAWPEPAPRTPGL